MNIGFSSLSLCAGNVFKGRFMCYQIYVCIQFIHNHNHKEAFACKKVNNKYISRSKAHAVIGVLWTFCG